MTHIKVTGSDIKDDYMFQNVMMEKKNCQVFLNSLFPNKNLRVINVESQDRVKPTQLSKVTVMDIIADDDKGQKYNIEMQVAREPDRDERAEFYASRLVQQTLFNGEKYHYRRRSYVIFIFAFDPFGLGLRRYTIKNMVIESRKAHFKGKSEIIYLNSKGTKGKISRDLQDFLNLMEDKPVSQGKAISQIEQAMNNVGKTKDWEARSMVLQFRVEEAIKKGRQLGIEEGEKEGRRIGKEEGRRIGREIGKKIGREEGRKIGREIGRKIGIEEGRIAGIKKTIRIFKRTNTSDDTIFSLIKGEYPDISDKKLKKMIAETE